MSCNNMLNKTFVLNNIQLLMNVVNSQWHVISRKLTGFFVNNVSYGTYYQISSKEITHLYMQRSTH